jgi:hypothetical protein
VTDRELLELAAKAAGITGEWTTTYGGWDCLVTEAMTTNPWQPLHNDGDALRLAVRLKLALFISENWCEALRIDIPTCAERPGNDPNAALRRAIVRAAAEIGKAMTKE